MSLHANVLTPTQTRLVLAAYYCHTSLLLLPWSPHTDTTGVTVLLLVLSCDHEVLACVHGQSPAWNRCNNEIATYYNWRSRQDQQGNQ